ncbi:hypothetical protein VIGAN_06074800 [Vigna angularis var. angularis]|uniref:Glucose-methanol-choline oxidoreductase C-terminal domain-containing protein n=1 Tax=Vigna angularis var. angularis TaxID=157739 RepID=A0A0S3SA29_PHAAN|nr:hypothetical protein VIGAN_06074800 [Vigna angularis var. angularis]
MGRDGLNMSFLMGPTIANGTGCNEKNLQKGIHKVLRILAAVGAEEIGTHHNKGRTLNVKQVSYHEFEKFVKEESSRPLADLSTPLCSTHQMGSCRMGFNPKQSMVNEIGETWEMEGLYVPLGGCVARY